MSLKITLDIGRRILAPKTVPNITSGWLLLKYVFLSGVRYFGGNIEESKPLAQYVPYSDSKKKGSLNFSALENNMNYNLNKRHLDNLKAMQECSFILQSFVFKRPAGFSSLDQKVGKSRHCLATTTDPWNNLIFANCTSVVVVMLIQLHYICFQNNG